MIPPMVGTGGRRRPGRGDAHDPRRDVMAAQAARLNVGALRLDGHDADAVRRLAVAEAVRVIGSSGADEWAVERLVAVVEQELTRAAGARQSHPEETL